MATTRERLNAAIQRLQEARDDFDAATRDLDWQHVNDGASWSILDHVRHTAHPGAYPLWIRSLASSPDWSPPDQSGPGGYWRWTRNNALQVIDDVITFAGQMSDATAERRTKMGSRELDIVDMLEGMAGHYQHHADDIRRMNSGQAAKPHDAKPGIVIADVEIFDEATYAEYNKAAPASVRAYGGEVVAMSDAPDTVELNVDDGGRRRSVVIRFPSLETARQWYASPEYQQAKAIRDRAARSTITIVEGR